MSEPIPTIATKQNPPGASRRRLVVILLLLVVLLPLGWFFFWPAPTQGKSSPSNANIIPANLLTAIGGEFV
ncbi:MAG: hypothetical protein U0903_15975 [Planctomycetales bacterium]